MSVSGFVLRFDVVIVRASKRHVNSYLRARKRIFSVSSQAQACDSAGASALVFFLQL
jgi:hypothetical protein